MNVASLSRDLWFLRTFKNGARFVLGFRTGKFPTEAIFHDGYALRHPPGLNGLVEVLFEILHDHVYTPAWFYKPRPNDTILDFGANIGVFSVSEARRNPTARLIAVEPHPDIFQQLIANVRPFSSRIQVYHAAVQGVDGFVQMHQPTERSLDMQTDGVANNSSITVPAMAFIRIIELVGERDVALLKCDIEGAEGEVFESASPEALRRVENFAIEYHDNIRPGTSDRLWNSLSLTHRLLHLSDNRGCGIMLWKRRDLVDAHRIKVQRG